MESKSKQSINRAFSASYPRLSAFIRGSSLRLGLLLAILFWHGTAQAAPPVKLLFLGDSGHHKPLDRFNQLKPAMAARDIAVTYTDKVESLNPKTLAEYDGLVIFANITKIEPEQEQALLDYVAGGKGLIPLHCATYCFLNSPKYIALVGGQFKRHGTGMFRDTVAEPDHPIMKGYSGFESWDETYVHHLHNEQDRTVLAYRVDAEGREPWTWVRTHGKGRVFYTAWGHDERTWSNPGFLNLVERGIRWAVGGDPSVVAVLASNVDPDAGAIPKMTPLTKDVKPFEYVEAKIAFYPPSGERKGDGWNRMQLPVAPAESQKHMSVPQGFRIELFAAEPDIGKPICLNWDERGRLWLAETVDYPNDLQPEGEGRDRIRICEDTDGDGRADKFTIFADKLSIPTSLTFSRDGVIVHQAPHTLFLQDTDGDDKADVRRVLFTGWSTRDTHAGPSNLQYGLDNWIWGMQGYAGFDGTVGGEQLKFSQGFYRFRPDGSKLEFVRSTNNNTWGIGFSEEGLVFGSTANRNPSVYMPIANRYYEAVRGWSASQLGTIADTHLFKAITEKVRQVDHHDGYTAAAGHALYTARNYPKLYWNRTAFVCEPTGHLVGTFVLNRDGGDFHSSNPFNLLASDDEWAAPIAAEVGPDGNVWVIDWYNYIVQHNPTPVGYKTGKGSAYETDLRDKQHGRIYRLAFGDARSAIVSLKDATPEQLVATLKSDNMFWRKHAQRLLVERGKTDVVPGLLELATDTSVDAIGLNTSVIHALWTLHGLGVLDGSHPQAAIVAAAGLKHQSAGVRQNAVAVLPRTNAWTASLLAGGTLSDNDAQVRLATLLALAEMPADVQAGAAVLAFLNQPANVGDHWLPDAATSAAAAHDVYFLQAAIAAKPSPSATKLLGVVGLVAEHYARGGPGDSAGSLIVSLAAADRATADAVVAGLAKGWPKNKPVTLDDATERSLSRLLDNLSPGSQGQLVKLATVWGSKSLEKYGQEIAARLLTVVLDAKQSDDGRIAAARQFVAFRSTDDKAADELLTVITPRTSPVLAAGLIEALSASQSPAVGPSVLARMNGLTPSAQATALRVLLGRVDWTQSLLSALEAGKIQMADLTLDQKQALASYPNRQLANRAKQLLQRGGGLPNADRQKVLADLMPLTERKADATAGKEVFKKQCAKCHTHSGEGNKVGPDLTGMAVHPKVELLTHVIDPSRSVEGNYRVYTVVTADGRILNGLLASETKTAIELFDAEGKKHAVLREDIEELVASPKSLMPEGFEKQVPPDDIANLLEFLTVRGKYLPLPLGKAATIVSTKGMFYSEDAVAERFIFADWSLKTHADVPFLLVDPQGDRIRNCVMLYGPQGKFPPQMPRSVVLPCNSAAKAVHLLGGVSGWGFPGGRKGSVSMIVRLHYADGQSEDHKLLNGEHVADYIRRIDVPGSEFAFSLRGQQLRHVTIQPKGDGIIKQIELIKGDDATAPIVMAATVETK